jgi:hypothetical protein
VPSNQERIDKLKESSKIADFEQTFALLRAAPKASPDDFDTLRRDLNVFGHKLRAKVERTPGMFSHMFSGNAAAVRVRDALLASVTAFEAELNEIGARNQASLALLTAQRNAVETLAGVTNSVTVTLPQPSDPVNRTLRGHVQALWTLRLEDVSETSKVVGRAIREPGSQSLMNLNALIEAIDRQAKAGTLIDRHLDALVWRFPDLWFHRLGESTSGVFKITVAPGEVRVFKPVDFEPFEPLGMQLPLLFAESDSEEDQKRSVERRHQRLGLVARTTAINEEAAFKLDRILGLHFSCVALANAPKCERITFVGKEGAAFAFMQGAEVKLSAPQAWVTDDVAHKFALFNYIVGQMDFWEAIKVGDTLVGIDNALALPDSMVAFPNTSEIAWASDGLKPQCQRPLSPELLAKVAALDPVAISEALTMGSPDLRPAQLLELRVRIHYLKHCLAGGKTLWDMGNLIARQLPTAYEAALATIGVPRATRYPVDDGDWAPLARALTAAFV